MLYRVIPISVLILLLVLPQTIRSQQDRWQSLGQIKAGEKVTVIDRQLATHTGKFLRFSETDLSLRETGKEITIDRDNVYRVTISGHHRGRNALIGLAAGAAVGGVLAGQMEREENYAAAATGCVAGFAAVGGGVGALIPGTRTVYRSSEGKRTSTKPATAGERARAE